MKPMYLNIKGRLFGLDKPCVMGILNVTPDSFYAASRMESETQIASRARQIVEQGGAIIDVGACSTRPGSSAVDEKEELRRLHLALDIINQELPDALLSVDTFRASVARECVQSHGVAIINDISAGDADGAMFETVAALKVPYVLTHNASLSTTEANDNFIKEVFLFLENKISQLRALAVNDIILDPGYGFGKTLEQNYALLHCLHDFELWELPLLVGISRKSMIYKALDITPDEALNGTTVLNSWALEHGASILRVHDVKEAVQVIQLYNRINP